MTIPEIAAKIEAEGKRLAAAYETTDNTVLQAGIAIYGASRLRQFAADLHAEGRRLGDIEDCDVDEVPA